MIKLNYKERSELEAILKPRASGEIFQRAQALLLSLQVEPPGAIDESRRALRQLLANKLISCQELCADHL